MADNKIVIGSGGGGETAKKIPQPPQVPQQQTQTQLPTSPAEDPGEPTRSLQPSPVVVVAGPQFISEAPLYVSTTQSPIFEQHQHQHHPPPPQFEVVNTKRPRFGGSGVGQWKLLTSPPQLQQQKPSQMVGLPPDTSRSSSISPPPNPNSNPHATTAASSSDTASSPSQSPAATTKPEAEHQQQQLIQPQQQHHHQFRKGKYVSPVWKPNEMLWLARAWRVQYQGGASGSGGGSSSDSRTPEHGGGDAAATAGRGKTRAEKDREVAEFLNRHGVNRDAKTAGTKWDNMLGEFRKVYEWERGGEREQFGKSYFRLSPYERKMRRLPASFDEEVFEELSQFMGPRMRSSGGLSAAHGGLSRSLSAIVGGGGGDEGGGVRALPLPLPLPPPPPAFKDDDPSSLMAAARTKQQLSMMSGGGSETFFHHGTQGASRGGLLLGFEPYLETGIGGPSTTLSKAEVRRIGKIRMTWEESVSLWAEEGEHHRGRVRLQGSSFLNADELTFLDDSMVACTMEAFEDGCLRGFSVDRFVPGQQVKVFGRRKSSSSSSSSSSGFAERFQLSFPESSLRYMPPWEFQDPTEYYVGCLRVPPATLPTLFELSWYLQEPPPEELRFPLRRDVYKDLPQGKELFFTTSHELLDSRSFAYDVLSSLIRTNPSLTSSTATSRDSFIGLWDDCVNRIMLRFCSVETVMIRKPAATSNAAEIAQPLQDQWPNVTGFTKGFCLWRGEETDQLRDGQIDPSSSIIEKLAWTYADIPYVLGYYAVGYLVTFCALSRSQDRVIRTDLYSLDLSSPTDRLKALVPCYRVAGLLTLLADRCFINTNNAAGSYKSNIFPYSDFERFDLGNGSIMEMTPNNVTRFYSSRRKWTAVKEIYEFLDHRIPHAEFMYHSSEKDLALVFKPRGCKLKPSNCEQLVEALMYVTKALVALHDLSFMHRRLSWDKVMRRSDSEGEWFVCGFDDADSAPQINPHGGVGEARGPHAPEMGRGLHGVKVDVWGVGQLVKTCGLTGGVPKMLRELQNRCLDQNPEHRPTAADCYHHLLQLQSSISSAASSGGGSGAVGY